MVRALLGDPVLGDAEAEGSAVSSCRLVFQSRPAPSAAADSHQRVEQLVHERARAGSTPCSR